MALRGDFQGGSHGGVNTFLGGGDTGNVAIEKYMKWNFAFFGGAVLVTATSIGTMIFWTSHITFAPATFFFEFFLLTFGVVMLVLDTPVPHMQNHKHIQAARLGIYKFVLFMTRFMGRGLWYLFLSTLVFGALWDTGINWFLGGVCTTYLLVLGVLAMGKGFIMSHKLNKVRETINHAGYSAERFISRGQTGLTADQFRTMIETTTNEKNLFNEDELDYIINALSFSPYNDGQVTMEELVYWLAPGPPLMV